MQRGLSCVLLFIRIISTVVVKPTCRSPGWEISPYDVPGAFGALQIHRHHQEHSPPPQKSAFEAAGFNAAVEMQTRSPCPAGAVTSPHGHGVRAAVRTCKETCPEARPSGAER